jgi:4-amino-4-deoxy-L-arabinose transferase-like glycosyltransferase
MMMLFLMSLYALVMYFESPSAKRLLVAGALSSVTLLLRPLVIFGVFCSFVAFSIHHNRNWKKIIDPPLAIFSLVSLLPSALYYGYGILFAGYMRWKIPSSFMPYLLLKRDFWLGWFDLIVNVAKFGPLLLAIAGFFLLRNSKVQYWMVGLAVAFMLFSVAFTYHIHTHPYYHIQLLPIVGLGMASTVASIAQALKNAVEKHWWIPLAAAFAFSSFLAYREFRAALYQDRMESPRVAWEIGETVHHSPRTVNVSFYYGIPLFYNGQFGGAPWPVRIEDAFYRHADERELSVEQRIDTLGFKPEFFVITNFDLYNRKHQDLKQYLEQQCRLLAHTDQYMVYSSCVR